MFRFLSVLFVVVAASSGLKTNSRILGGSDAEIADFPFILSIELAGFGHFCGAVIVSPDWALTDAWCAEEPANIADFSLRSGSSLLGAGTQHNVLQWVYHPQNNPEANEYDFALVQVNPPFTFGPNVAAVTLPEQEQGTPDGAAALIAGWGESIFTPENTTAQLQFAETAVLGEAACSASLGANFQNSKLCAQDPSGVAAHCSEDEGGPLVVDGTLYGIAQWPGRCADPAALHIFSRVASVRTWIDATIGA